MSTQHLYRPSTWTEDAGYRIDPVPGGYTWVYLDAGLVLATTEESWPTQAEALRAAARDAEATFTDIGVGAEVARALRLAAAILVRTERAIA